MSAVPFATVRTFAYNRDVLVDRWLNSVFAVNHDKSLQEGHALL